MERACQEGHAFGTFFSRVAAEFP